MLLLVVKNIGGSHIAACILSSRACIGYTAVNKNRTKHASHDLSIFSSAYKTAGYALYFSGNFDHIRQRLINQMLWHENEKYLVSVAVAGLYLVSPLISICLNKMIAIDLPSLHETMQIYCWSLQASEEFWGFGRPLLVCDFSVTTTCCSKIFIVMIIYCWWMWGWWW